VRRNSQGWFQPQALTILVAETRIVQSGGRRLLVSCALNQKDAADAWYHAPSHLTLRQLELRLCTLSHPTLHIPNACDVATARPGRVAINLAGAARLQRHRKPHTNTEAGRATGQEAGCLCWDWERSSKR
jgi:hypothetical protein